VRAMEALRIATLEQSGHVIVLGSGLLWETPLAILQERFSKITLVDVVHVKEVREALKKHAATAGAIDDRRGIGHGVGIGHGGAAAQIELLEMDLNRQVPPGKYDFVISANVLSQLPLVPTQLLRKKGASSTALMQTADNLQKLHLQMVRELAPHGFMMSDYELHIHDLEGEIVETGETVSKRLEVAWEKSWNWNLAPAPELSTAYSVQLKVGVKTW
jgi:hypothetical protein